MSLKKLEQICELLPDFPNTAITPSLPPPLTYRHKPHSSSPPSHRRNQHLLVFSLQSAAYHAVHERHLGLCDAQNCLFVTHSASTTPRVHDTAAGRGIVGFFLFILFICMDNCFLSDNMESRKLFMLLRALFLLHSTGCDNKRNYKA